ncbi:MAG: sulfite exporter TauE/SafE family protein [Pseudonocardiaceae bacterium]|nr:MAG: sulfite exporter TauE/SafE family protein [Pseudonocardiaceae bacterium]
MIALAAVVGLIMGGVIGALGGGGGVLTVPALVYLLGQSAQAATASSVVIVGVTAAAGVVSRLRSGGVDWRTGIALGAAGIPAAYLGTLLNRHVEQPVLLLAFAGLTIVAAAAMLLDERRRDGDDDTAGAADVRDGDGAPAAASGAGTTLGTRPATRDRVLFAAKVIGTGLAVGFLTGFLGVGGGFLVVPALVIVLRTPMKFAIGTSLLVIVMNSVSALVSRLGAVHLDWWVIAPFTIAAVLGAVLGKRVADRFSGDALVRAFAILLVVVGLGVGVQSLVAL